MGINMKRKQDHKRNHVPEHVDRNVMWRSWRARYLSHIQDILPLRSKEWQWQVDENFR
jgi:hypothetical protein